MERTNCNVTYEEKSVFSFFFTNPGCPRLSVSLLYLSVNGMNKFRITKLFLIGQITLFQNKKKPFYVR